MDGQEPMLSELVKQTNTLTGNEPGLPRLHQLRWQEMSVNEVIDLLDEMRQRLFACDCAEKALAIVESPDQRSLDAVRVARLYAGGKVTQNELAAARDAARAAAWDAAWDAARDAAWAAAWDAARAAAWDAARDAARDAAWDAAWDAARDAAWDAARDAAWAAAWAAAWDAARAAARDAAWAAAWDAAWAAARQWQKDRLIAYLSGRAEPLRLVEGTYE